MRPLTHLARMWQCVNLAKINVEEAAVSKRALMRQVFANHFGHRWIEVVPWFTSLEANQTPAPRVVNTRLLVQSQPCCVDCPGASVDGRKPPFVSCSNAVPAHQCIPGTPDVVAHRIMRHISQLVHNSSNRIGLSASNVPVGTRYIGKPLPEEGAVAHEQRLATSWPVGCSNGRWPAWVYDACCFQVDAREGLVRRYQTPTSRDSKFSSILECNDNVTHGKQYRPYMYAAHAGSYEYPEVRSSHVKR